MMYPKKLTWPAASCRSDVHTMVCDFGIFIACETGSRELQQK